MQLATRFSFSLSCFILLLLYDTDKSLASASSLIKLEEGITYVYSLEGNTETLLPKTKGPFGESVKLNVKAKVEVSALPQSKALIKLKSVQITGPDTKKYGNLVKLEEHPLLVVFSGSRIEPTVYTVKGDSFASLNIKRAVASLFQISSDEDGGSSDEIDVFGNCPTNFRISKDGETVVVNKYRNLNRCQYRESLKSGVFALPHVHSSDFYSSPLLEPEFEVEQRIKDSVLISAVVHENYLFKPFSNRDHGAKTKITTRLTLDSKSNAAAPAHKNDQTSSIIFENPHEKSMPMRSSVLAQLHKIVDNVDASVPTSAAQDFGAFVHLVRSATKDDLISVYGDAKSGAGFKNKDLAKKVFLDALFRAKSADSVAVAAELLKNNEIDNRLARIWYLSFAFIRHATAASLADAASVLSQPKLPREAYLGYGALAGQYCREHSCDSVPELDLLISKFLSVIENPAKLTKDQENLVLAALKGLRNIRHLNEEASNKIIQIIKDPNVSTRVRVAALETAQNGACQSKLKSAASDLLANREEDSEIRIKAYLILVECPCSKTANKLSELLETEPVNQVGTFITSHLRSLRNTVNPDKQIAREVLQNVKSKKRFPIDYRKFSHNHEFSYNIDSLSTSAALDSNVIYSQKSYLPRSVNLNITAEIFGKAFNFFELSGRAENLERVLENYFGPKGYFNTRKPEDILRDGKSTVENFRKRVAEEYGSLVRNKRSVTRQQTDSFASKVKLYNSELDNNIDVDLSLKFLGNELIWLNLDDSKAPLTVSTLVDRISELFENGVKGAKNFKHDLRNHYHFLDSELNYPTSTGFPLRLSAFGSTVVDLKFGGSMDVGSILRNPKNGEIKFSIIPSAAIHITGEMTVSAYSVEAGLKFLGTLHTSTGSEVHLKLLDGKGFDLNVGLPVKNSDIITINTQILTSVRDNSPVSVDTALEFQLPRRDYHGCFDQLLNVIGLTFCGDVGFPFDQQPLTTNAAFYPLNGPSKLSLRLDKDDDSLKTYHFKFFYDIYNPKSRRVEFLIDTPGSKVQREISFVASAVTDPNYAVNVNFVSPIYKFSMEGAVIDTDAEYSVKGSINMDDTMMYSARAGMMINGATYTPVLEYTPFGSTPVDIKVDGTITVEKRPPYRKYTFNHVKLIFPSSVYTIDGNIIKDTDLFQVDGTVGYDKHNVAVKAKFQRQGTSPNIKITAQIQPSQYPDASVSVKYEYQRDGSHIENSLILVHGPDLNSQRTRLTIFQQLHYKVESATSFDISTKNTLTYPLFGIEGKFEGAVTKRSVSYDLDITYDKSKVKSKLNAKTAINKFGDYEIDFQVLAFEREAVLEFKREILDTYKSKFSNKIVLKPGGKYELNADVTHQFRSNDFNGRVIAVLKVEGNSDDYKVDVALVSNPTVFDSHSQISLGNREYFHGALKYSRAGPPNGNFKFNIRNIVESNGEYKYTDGKGIAVAVIHVTALKRKIKGSADLTIVGSQHTGLIEILFDADRDVSKKLLIETDTDLTKSSIISKNKLKFLESQLQVDFVGEHHGRTTNGGSKGGYEITLPSGKFCFGSFKQTLQVIPSGTNAEFYLELGSAETRSSPFYKVFLDTYARNVDIKKFAADTKFEVGYDSQNPKSPANVKFTQLFRSTPQDGKLVLGIQSSLTGSLLEKVYRADTHLTVSKSDLVYQTSVVIQEFSFSSKGKIVSTYKLFGFEHETELKTPKEYLKILKVVHSLNVKEVEDTKARQVKLIEEVNWNDKFYKVEGEGELSLKHGRVKGALTLSGEAKPYTVEINYKHDAGNELRKSELIIKGICPTEQSIVLNFRSEYNKDLSVVNNYITGQTPYKDAETFNIQVLYKRLSSFARSTDLKFTLNNQKIEGSAKVDVTPNHPVIDFVVITSAGKNRLYYKLDKKTERQGSSEGQIAWAKNGGYVINFSSKVDLTSLENFLVNFKVETEKGKDKKFKIEIGNKPTKSGSANKIHFTAEIPDKKGFSGSVTYALKDTDVGYVVEGKGNIEFASEKHPITYKLTHKRLVQAIDKETGNSVVFTADYGKGNLLLENKLTNRGISYKSQHCKGSDCTLFVIHSSVVIDYLELKQEASIVYENKLYGKSDSFKFFTNTHRKGLIVDHETGLKLKNAEYNLKSYIHADEGAVTINIPSREIAAIATYELPFLSKNKNNPNNVKVRFDGSLYLDKKKNPSDKANLFILGEATSAQRIVSLNGEIKFSHPSLQKDLYIKTKGALGLERRLIDASIDFDLFNKKNNKITASLKLDHEKNKNGHNVTGKLDIVSKGMLLDIGANGHVFGSKDGFSAGSFIYYVDAKNIKRDIGGYAEILPSRVFAVVKIPNKELFKVDSKVSISRDQQIVEGELSLAEQKTFVGRVEILGLNILKGSVYRKDNPNEVLQGIVGVSPQQIEVRAEKSAGGQKENLFFLVLKLDETNTFKPSYELNSEKLKAIINAVRKESVDLVNQIEKLAIELFRELSTEVNNLLDSIKKAQPLLFPLSDYYKAQFEKILKELEEDPEFKKLSDVVRKTVGGLIEALRQQINSLIAFYERIQKETIELQDQLIVAYKKFFADLEICHKRFIEGVSAFYGHASEHLAIAFNRLLEILKEHEADIRQLIVNVSENLQDLTKVTLRTVAQLRKEIEEFVRVLIDEIKALPLYHNLKERYQELLAYELPPQFWNFYSEIAFAIDDFLPTAELKELTRNIFEYIEKRLKKEEVNDLAALTNISENFYKAFFSILELLKQQYVIEDPSSWFGFNVKLPVPSFLLKIPQIVSLGDSSLVRYIKSFKDLPSISDYYYTYRPTLNPLDYIPPYKAYGLILNSHHFFTFDRKHFAFKGSCSYILAQDFQDGNFSIIANLDNGKLRSITVNDRVDSVEILHDNTVNVNGKIGDYPVRRNDFTGWRRYGSVNLKNKAGIFITRYLKHDVYVIRVSGFYFGRTRGLLGTINNEQYDEFTLPNGKIAQDAGEFGNAYKVTDSCANVPDLKNLGSHAPECNKLFTSDSSLSSSFPYINPDVYREACDQHVAMAPNDKAKAACEVVYAYVTALKQEQVPFASLPAECAVCSVEGKPLELGYSTSIQSPRGKADVIFVFEQSSHNAPVFKELLTPLINTLSVDLKEKGINDIEYSLIGFDGPGQDWPAHYGNNGKITYAGKSDNIVFGDNEKLKGPYDTWIKKLKYLVNVVNIELGNEQIVIAMNEANIYPFRQGAAKLIVLINSTPCSKSPLFPISLQIPRIINIWKHYRDHGLKLFIVSPLPSLTTTDKPDQKLKNIVGFDKDRIYTFADAKKLEGDESIRPNLQYEEDLCLAFSQHYGEAAFSSQNFIDSKPDQRKKFVQVVSQRIVKSAVAQDYVEDCTCNLYHGLFSYPECKIYSKEVV